MNNPDGSPMFGNGDDDVYRPFMAGTTGSTDSNLDPNTQFDPDFTTDSYGLDDMEPSSMPVQPSAPEAKKKKKKKMAHKNPVNEEYAPGRTNYTDEETVLLAKCWIDASEDPIISNYVKGGVYWDRILERYNALKPASAYKRHKEQLRKHWERVKKEVNLFSAEFTQALRSQASGESLDDVRNKALMSYRSCYGVFKHYNVWLLVRDLPKFQGGIEAPTAAAKRAKNTVVGGYTSSGGYEKPVDLNEEPTESSRTPMSTARRPTGSKAAKGKGKATSSASVAPPEPEAPKDAQLDDLLTLGRQRTLLDAHNAL